MFMKILLYDHNNFISNLESVMSSFEKLCSSVEMECKNCLDVAAIYKIDSRVCIRTMRGHNLSICNINKEN